ncbi:MAG: hypothetical protein ABW049_02515 [Spongiibacteraceae bacterium]
MSSPTVFVIKNQAGQFLNKQQEWIDAGDRQVLYRTAHRDEAVNTVFEVSSKDIYLRAEAIACAVDSKGQPLLENIDLLTPESGPGTVDDEIAITGEALIAPKTSIELESQNVAEESVAAQELETPPEDLA